MINFTSGPIDCWVVHDKNGKFKLKDVFWHQDEAMLSCRRKSKSDQEFVRQWQVSSATLQIGKDKIEEGHQS